MANGDYYGNVGTGGGGSPNSTSDPGTIDYFPLSAGLFLGQAPPGAAASDLSWWQKAKIYARAVGEGLAEGLGNVKDAGSEIVTETYQAVRHPINTIGNMAQGTKQLVTHPIDTTRAIIDNTVEEFQHNPGKAAAKWGLNTLLGAAGTKGLDKLKNLNKARKLRNTATAGDCAGAARRTAGPAVEKVAPTRGGKLFGLREWEVAPGQQAKAAKTLQQLEADYFKATGRRPVVLDADHPQGALGYIDPKTGYIELYSGERFGSAARAEELFHYQQLKARGLLGKTEAEIGPKVIQEMEQEVEQLLRSGGFQPKR
jgi:hypothetical protein